jgi:hypothetical protein
MSSNVLGIPSYSDVLTKPRAASNRLSGCASGRKPGELDVGEAGRLAVPTAELREKADPHRRGPVVIDIVGYFAHRLAHRSQTRMHEAQYG